MCRLHHASLIGVLNRRPGKLDWRAESRQTRSGQWVMLTCAVVVHHQLSGQADLSTNQAAIRANRLAMILLMQAGSLRTTCCVVGWTRSTSWIAERFTSPTNTWPYRVVYVAWPSEVMVGRAFFTRPTAWSKPLLWEGICAESYCIAERISRPTWVSAKRFTQPATVAKLNFFFPKTSKFSIIEWNTGTCYCMKSCLDTFEVQISFKFHFFFTYLEVIRI